jgi:hypothetical protein
MASNPLGAGSWSPLKTIGETVQNINSTDTSLSDTLVAVVIAGQVCK